jgi:hypothetical protein
MLHEEILILIPFPELAFSHGPETPLLHWENPGRQHKNGPWFCLNHGPREFFTAGFGPRDLNRQINPQDEYRHYSRAL